MKMVQLSNNSNIDDDDDDDGGGYNRAKCLNLLQEIYIFGWIDEKREMEEKWKRRKILSFEIDRIFSKSISQ